MTDTYEDSVNIRLHYGVVITITRLKTKYTGVPTSTALISEWFLTILFSKKLEF